MAAICCREATGGSPPLLPPPTYSKATLEVTSAGIVNVSQCCHLVRSTSSAVSQVCETRSTTMVVRSSTSALETIFHA